MPSFNGTITYEGAEPSDALVQAAIRAATNTRMLKTHAGLPRLIKAYDLPNGAQVYVHDMEHVRQVHIVNVPEHEEAELELPDPGEGVGAEAVALASFLSGTATGIELEDKEISWPDVPDGPGVPSTVVETIRDDAFELVPESKELFPQDQASHKLGVPLADTHQTVGDMRRRSQFFRVIPGQFTGGMVAVVQLLLGFGRFVVPDYYERWLTLPFSSPLITEVSDDDDDDDLPLSVFSPGTSLQITYDYRWNRTHGVLWADMSEPPDSGEFAMTHMPMLVELGQRGAYAMPLPVDPLSEEEAIQEHYATVYPDLLKYTPFKDGQQNIFQALGGIPTGGNFPANTQELRRMQRAGLVVAQEDALTRFYAGSPISSGFGWAFHPRQGRAVNTMYTYEDGKKMGVCAEVIVELREKPDSQKVRNPLAGELVAVLGLTDPLDEFKAQRLTEAQSRQLLQNMDYDEFDEMQATPDWEFSVRYQEVSRGNIDYPGFQCPRLEPCGVIDSPHFKYFDPVLGEVMSFNFESESRAGESFTADGPIFATYRYSGLEVLNYYYEPQTTERVEIDTRQRCQFTGQWQTGHLTEGEQLRGNFYTTSRDFRERTVVGGGRLRTTTGQVLGHADSANFGLVFGQHSTLTRTFYGTESWEEESWTGKSYYVSVMAAANNRSAFLVCMERQKRDISTSRGFSGLLSLGTSGAVKRGIIYNFHFHWLATGDWGCLTDPICVHRTCRTDIVNPDSCFGTEPPIDFAYSVCPPTGYAADDIVINAPPTWGSSFGPQGDYTPRPTAPPSWSTTDPARRWDYEWEVWAYGMNLLHARRLHVEKLTVTDPSQVVERASETDWWRCSIPGECPARSWRVGQNEYGITKVVARRNLKDATELDLGAPLSVGFGAIHVPFGVVR